MATSSKGLSISNSTPGQVEEDGHFAIDQSIAFLEEHLGESLPLSKLAAVSGYSRFHFLRLFKAVTGQTPHAYLMQRRVDHAKELLKSGQPIAEVAYATGFTDQAHFSRRFKRSVGMTPGAFSRSLRDAPYALSVSSAPRRPDPRTILGSHAARWAALFGGSLRAFVEQRS